MKQMLSLLAVAAFCVSLPAKAHAQAVTLDEIRAHALNHSSEIAVIDAGLAAALGESIATEQLSNPRISAEIELPVGYQGKRPKNELKLELSQTLRLSDLGASLGSRSSVARLQEELAKQNREIELTEFLARLAQAYSALWVLQEEVHHLNKQLSSAKHIVRLLAKPASTGSFTEPQKHRAEAAVARLKADLQGASHATAVAKAELTRLSEFSIGNRKLEKPKLDKLPKYETLKRKLQSNASSILRRYRLQYSLAESQAALARNDRFSSLRPSLGYTRNEEGVDFIGIGVSFALPVFDQNTSQRAIRNAEVTRSNAGMRYLKSDAFQREFRLRYDGAKSKIAQARQYEASVIPKLTQALKGSEHLFQNGQLSLFELWTLQTEHHEAIDIATELWREAFQESIALSVLSGEIFF